MIDNEEEMNAFFTDSSNYLESLIRGRQHLKDAPQLLAKLDNVINLELDMALEGVNKAIRETKKERAKENVVEIKR